MEHRNLSHRARARLAVLLTFASLLNACAADRLEELRGVVETRIGASGAEVGFYFEDLVTGETLLVNPDLRMHAASTMKVPIMIQAFRDADAGVLDLDSAVEIRNEFSSIVDGSPYRLNLEDDSEGELYSRIGERVPIIDLIGPMIHTSSNLATNLLVEIVGADRAQASMRELGADSIAVLRGVEDIKAYEAGLSNTTTARDLGMIFGAIADGRAAGETSTAEMIEILAEQNFNAGIPAGVPAGTRVAHKTGTITRIHHDAGLVYRGDADGYVLVVLTRGFETEESADSLIEQLSRDVYETLYRDRPLRPSDGD